MPGNPYDGHTLATVLPEIEAQIGAPLTRVVADRGYRRHNAPPDLKFKVYVSGQRRSVTDAIKRELRRRSAAEPVIGHGLRLRLHGANREVSQIPRSAPQKDLRLEHRGRLGPGRHHGGDEGPPSSLTTWSCRFEGSRVATAWSFCPCGRRARILRLFGGGLACSQCLRARGLRPRVELVRTEKRAADYAPKLVARLNSNTPARLFRRPERMLDRRANMELALKRSRIVEPRTKIAEFE
jgi:hypothetical protein